MTLIDMAQCASIDDATPIVVLVEDDFLIRMSTAAALAEDGFIVIEAADADEAIRLLIAEAAHVRILFTDINMPGPMDGLMLARHAHQLWPWIDLIVTSGQVRPTADDMPPRGHFIPKPYSPETVLRHMRGIGKPMPGAGA
jgi:CheY-like chemotaxis protein